jgi:hypothetical protein
MSKPRRGTSLHGSGSNALTPASPRFADDDKQIAWKHEHEKEWMQSLLASERRRHASVEKVLTHHIKTLEAQIADLRSLYFEKLALPTGEKK